MYTQEQFDALQRILQPSSCGTRIPKLAVLISTSDVYHARIYNVTLVTVTPKIGIYQNDKLNTAECELQ